MQLRSWCRPAILWSALGFALAGCEKEPVNHPPVALASEDAHVFLGEDAALDASESFDPDEDPITFAWTVISAPEESAIEPASAAGTTASIAFTPDVPGIFVLSVQVADEDELFSTDVVAVEARRPLGVVHLAPEDGAIDVAGLAPVVAIFDAPIRPWTAGTIAVEDLTDPGAPVPVVGNVELDPDGTAIVFTPVAAWVDGTPYRVTVPAGGPLGLDGAPLAASVSASFTAADTDASPPRVVSVSPAATVTDAALSTIVEVVFSEAVEPASAALAFTLDLQAGGSQSAELHLSAGGVVARLVPVSAPGDAVALPASTDFVFGIADTLTDLAGIALDGDADGSAGTDFASAFRTASGADTAAPSVVSVSPFRGASGVSVKLPTVVTFSEPVEPASVAGTMTLTTGAAPGVAGTIALHAGNRVAIFTPDLNLSTASRYDFAIAAGVTDLAGNALGSYSSYFVTGNAPPPTVLGSTPDGAPVGETEVVDVLGEDFVDGATAIVSGGGVLVSQTTWISETRLQCSITLAPSAAFGPRTLVVINPDGQQGDGPGLFEVRRRPPSVAAITPDEGGRGSTVTVSITGTDFDCSGGPPQVSLNDLNIPDVAADCLGSTSPTENTIEATFAIGASATVGLHTLTVTNADASFDDVPGAFDVKAAPPDVTSISLATSGRRRDTVTVQINGSGFQATPSVSFGSGVGVSSVTFNSPAQLTVDVVLSANAALGARNVTVTNGDGQSDVLAAAFTVLRAVPTVASAAPSDGSRLEPAFAVTLTGDDFDCSGATPGVDFGGAGVQINTVSCNGSTSDSADTLIVNLQVNAGASLGARNVFVTNSGDGTSGQGTGIFTVLAEIPTVATASSVAQGQTAEVTITGTNFLATPVVTTAAPGASVGTVTFVSSTEVRAFITVPLTTAAATYNLTVTNSDGQGATASVFTVDPAPSPLVTGVSPVRGAKGTTLTVTVTGANFQTNATVSFEGQGTDITNNGTTFVDSGTLTVSITISAGATSFTSRDVTVTNLVGASPADVATDAFTVTDTPPSVSSISQTTGGQGASFTGVTITGTNFRAGAVPTLPGGAVNGITLTNVSVTVPSTITFDLDVSANASVGARDVVVTNTDTSTGTLAGGFTVLSTGNPSIAAITRAPFLVGGDGSRRDDGTSIRQGETAVFHITGSDFDGDSTIQVSGAGITVSNVTIVDSTRIDVTLAASCGDLAPGRRDVTVFNPTDGKSGTLVDGLGLRIGVVINELTTASSTGHGFGGGGREVVEIFNGSGCTWNILNWRLDIIDAGGFTGYEIGSGNEDYSGTATAINFTAGSYLLIERPDGGGNNMSDNVYLALDTITGRAADDVEVGDNEENDTVDGAPSAGDNGDSGSGSASEMVGRCANGQDTENDQNDFYQEENATFLMAATDLDTNNTQCPPCADGADNDNDGWIDILDGGCSSAHGDTSENSDATTLECNDGIDNGDPDGLVDAADPECRSGADTSEASY